MIFAANIYADEKIDRVDMPSAVIYSFQREHSTANVIGYWRIQENSMTLYKVMETEQMKMVSLVYNAGGGLLKTIEESAVEMLPLEIIRSIGMKYPDEQVVETVKVMAGTNISYETEMMRSDNSIHKVVFDLAGEIVSDKPVDVMIKSRMIW
jgi:hypothetical protein